MTYRGRVQNGVVVFDGPSLPDGTEVTLQPKSAERGSAANFMRFAGIWRNCREEVDQSLAELRGMKQAELQAEREREDRLSQEGL